jgi:hypothetical protein
VNLTSRHGALLELMHTIVLTVLKLVFGGFPVAMGKILELVLPTFFGVLIDASSACGFAPGRVVDTYPGLVIALFRLLSSFDHSYLDWLAHGAGVGNLRVVARIW